MQLVPVRLHVCTLCVHVLVNLYIVCTCIYMYMCVGEREAGRCAVQCVGEGDPAIVSLGGPGQ